MNLFIFIGITGLYNSMASVHPVLTPGISANNPGFDIQNSSQILLLNKCSGTSSLYYKNVITTNTYYLPCSQFKDASLCNSFANCNFTSIWEFWFINITGCSGYTKDTEEIGNELYKVNLSRYGFPGSLEANSSSPFYGFYTEYFGEGFCDSDNASGLGNYYTCEQFGCIWQNTTQYFNQNKIAFSTTYNPIGVWDSVIWVVSFKFDMGWGDLNWVISFLFYILNGAFLILALYYIFVPY